MRNGILMLGSLAIACSGCAKNATVEERVAQYGDIVQARLAPLFVASEIACPPPSITLVGLKEEKKLELYAPAADGSQKLIKTYPILAASGTAGPKLKEGDKQVPEGFYKIESLNPNSRFHLSLRVNYPNAEDKQRAAKEGRAKLGGDIMIHGNSVSIGCLAMGDPAAEELFILAAKTGLANIEVLLCPVDFRARPNFQPPASAPSWTAELYNRLKTKLAEFK
jgi:Uncharacterized protein conserved in bacteria